ncbi:hypothetical protein [Aeromonas australiensis]|uniref:hypothetical protein n=1 Tax=Aeromonas australiensis TaxID=1114880 RepID=UPI0012E0BA72|nr:hypothetical protein [Aeromonas australiensis]
MQLLAPYLPKAVGLPAENNQGFGTPGMPSRCIGAHGNKLYAHARQSQTTGNRIEWLRIHSWGMLPVAAESAKLVVAVVEAGEKGAA